MLAISSLTSNIDLSEHPADSGRDEAGRLRRRFESLLLSIRTPIVLGRNTEVEDLAAEIGIHASHYSAFQVNVHGKDTCALCVPARVWGRSQAMARFVDLREAAAEVGHRVKLIPETLIRDRRYRGLQMVTVPSARSISNADRVTILEHLLTNERTTLFGLAGLLRHPTPVDAVLQLVVSGVLDIDLDAPICSSSNVSFARWDS